MTIKLGVLISGTGTNLRAILEAIDAGKLDASVEVVISSNETAKGLRIAGDRSIDTMALTPDTYSDPAVADQIIASVLKQHEVDYVVMAGYMRMVTESLLLAFPNRIINLHPALLPSFPGAHGIQDALDYGVKVTGVTVHFANAQYDEGPIIAQRVILIEDGMDLDELEDRVHAVEHKLYPEVLQMIAEGRVQVLDNNTVKID